ncbi:MAG: DUF72 domain-containing protein [Acidobacteriota bacterium]
MTSSGPEAYRLGLPFWGLAGWAGLFYPKGARAADFLRHYATVFTTVEGNTTFYSLPSEDTVLKWRDATPESFRFCFKLPKLITHEKSLEHAQADVAFFFERLKPLWPRFGPFLIQLPPSFGPERLGVLDRFLESLAQIAPAHRFAVELRQTVFYEGALAHDVDALLSGHGVDRCVIDTRALRRGDGSREDVIAARRKKPNLPAPAVAVGDRPMVRLIGHPDFETTAPQIEFWASAVARWIGEGREPHCFIHLPDNLRAPQLARVFHETLGRHLEQADLPPFPAESEPSQLQLF